MYHCPYCGCTHPRQHQIGCPFQSIDPGFAFEDDDAPVVPILSDDY